MMRQLRQNTKIILWIVVVAFVTTIFAVWGMDLKTGSPSSDPSLLGKVNGTPITRAQYRAVYDQLTEQYKQMSPDGQLTYAQMEMIEGQIWDNIIMAILTDQKIEELGIGVTDEEIVNFLRNTPPPEIYPYFQDEQGNFDYQAYQQALNNPEADWTSLENLARQRLPRIKLNQYLSTQIHVSQDDVRRAYEEANLDLVARYVQFSISSEELAGYEPTDQEIETHYNDNIDEYTEGEKAAIELAAIEIKPGAVDHEDIQYTLNSIRGRLLGGDDFADMASTYSQRMTAENGGEAGWLRPDPDRPEIYETLADLEDNDLSLPVLAGDGYFLLKRLGQRTGEDGTVEYNALEIYMKLEAGSKTYDSLSTAANTLLDQARESGLEDAAREMGLELIKPAPVYKDFPFEELGMVPALNKFAFENEPGTLSNILRDEHHFYVCRVTNRIPATAKPIDEVKDQIRSELLLQRQKRQAWRKADGFFRQVVSLGFEKTAETHGLTIELPDTFQVVDNVIPFGRRSLFARTALSLPVGSISPPLELPDRYLVIQLLHRSEVNEEELNQNIAGLFNRLYQEKLNEYIAFWYDDMKEKSEVEDYRSSL